MEEGLAAVMFGDSSLRKGGKLNGHHSQRKQMYPQRQRSRNNFTTYVCVPIRSYGKQWEVGGSRSIWRVSV